MSTDWKKYDVVIIGGGPAGMSAALWCGEMGFSSVLIERELAPGGQLAAIHNPITNYIGVNAANGGELLARFTESLDRLTFERAPGADITDIDLEGKIVRSADGRAFAGRSLIIATGVRRRILGVPGENEFRGRGVMTSGAKERELAAGKAVVIIGGGDAALENALILSGYAERVIVVHRRASFSARDEFLDQVKLRSNVLLVTESNIVSINGHEAVDSITVRSTSGSEMTIPADLVLIRIGVIPNTDLITGKLATDQAGYIIVDACGRTSRTNIFAIGDVANPLAPTISTAVGTASTAIKSLLTNPIN
jgi:thioredoxin reductase (NADPH)